MQSFTSDGDISFTFWEGGGTAGVPFTCHTFPMGQGRNSEDITLWTHLHRIINPHSCRDGTSR
jgi:hypothetical protein